ncbi:CIC11C00000000615 [Sungouiella intermedia]|uniref:CIC11C00000000615 n=1 Tax=Sungouiella intermedia TaxID=45354 RepID=A0A1L0BI72_9ASCO|nr:CIC11C00000000615 [[Candida] intermedia]
MTTATYSELFLTSFASASMIADGLRGFWDKSSFKVIAGTDSRPWGLAGGCEDTVMGMFT